MRSSECSLAARPWNAPGARWAWPLGLALLGGLVPAVVWWLVRPADLGGSDPGMWENAALVMGRGGSSPVAPLFPFLTSLAHRLLGLPLDLAGWCIAVAATVGLGPATWALARALGAPCWLAALAALAALGEPWLAGASCQCQPDTLTALAFVLAVLAARRWVAAPSRGRLAALLIAVGFLPQVREHAALVTLGLLGVLALAPGSPRQRAGRTLAGVVVIGLAPLLLGEAAGLPWQLPWVQARWGEVIAHFFSPRIPFHLQGTPPGFREAFEASYQRGERTGIAWQHFALSFHSGHAPWLWLGLGAVGLALLRRGRVCVLACLLPVIAVFGGAQQPRHVAVLVPIAAACWAASLARFGRAERYVLAALTLIVPAVGLADGPRVAAALRSSADQRALLRSLSAQLCAQLPDDALYTGEHPRTLVYCWREQAPWAEAARTDRHLYWVQGVGQRPPEPLPVLFREGWEILPIEGDAGFAIHRPPRGAQGGEGSAASEE